MSLKTENGGLAEKHANDAPVNEPATLGGHKRDSYSAGADPEIMVATSKNALHQALKGRHMQMIAMQVQHINSSSVC